MKKNIGNVDRAVRIVAAAAIAFLIFSETVAGGWMIVLSVFGGLFFLTAVAGDCPLYTLLGIRTCHVKPVKGSHKTVHH